MITQEQGFSLLEALIALALLSIGLLGFAEAQLAAFKQDQIAYLYTVAGVQLKNMAQLIHACELEGQLSAACLSPEITYWQKENNRLFPQADSKVTSKGFAYQLTIDWQLPVRGQTTASQNFSVSQEIVP